MSAKQTVEDAIAGNKIVIFSKSYCPYCRKAKNLLTSDFAHLKDQIYIKELDQSPDGREIQDYLQEKTGQSTVPNIFINQRHVGGCDKVVTLKDGGKLAGLVEVVS
ncbi:glutaredoxin [Thelephora ganbajun]|uniref:Glutaredoxin n=1 Tax=Thelephora ganbajun TaxID=370292 RepID=A0ACB6ZX32_THEGA|nr:glutaredoxin [Thelephora ganbajun]